MNRVKTLVAMLAIALPVAALAHAHLESSVPAKGSTLRSSPDKVVLVFNEAVDLSALKLQKVGEKTTRDLGPLPKADAARFEVPLPHLADGDYVLTYEAQSSDLHDSNGTIAFKVSATALAR